MFSENDRISQRQMERQIVLVLLCPAFWQLAAYGASDGLPGMAGIFVGYGLLAVWCIYLVRLGGLYCRLESVMGKAGKLLLAVMYLCYLLFLGGTLLRRMAELAAAYLTSINFIHPYFRNLILAFNTDTSSPSCGTTAGTLHSAVRCYFSFHSFVPFFSQEFFRNTNINEIPREHFIFIAFS